MSIKKKISDNNFFRLLGRLGYDISLYCRECIIYRSGLAPFLIF